MTYLVIGNNQETIRKTITEIINILWEKKIKDNIFESNNPDIHILKGTNLDSIGIDDVKALQKEMIYSPHGEAVQIALILNAEKLTIQAQNSFLKTLEEAPQSTCYILVTNNEKHLLPTVVSRSLKIYTKEMKEEYRENEDIEILQMDMVEAFGKIENISKNKTDTLNFLKLLELHFQDTIEKEIVKGENNKQIFTYIEKILLTQKRVEANGNRRLLLENLFLQLTKNYTLNIS
ncbi:hypothetical protein GX888_01495 [Candidatus Dojkabacteria bacterium]|uniref:DNA polymerase III subunit delta n=1 Tax=Candidatus Dojkabacteria bacterium TaxID=2099670 RepID=A0A847VCX9_9BACT|nr:hypothetical protein [Candidatus Dojkabacteria bacterium]